MIFIAINSNIYNRIFHNVIMKCLSHYLSQKNIIKKKFAKIFITIFITRTSRKITTYEFIKNHKMNKKKFFIENYEHEKHKTTHQI